MRPITEEELKTMSRPSEDYYTSEPSVSMMTGLLNMLGIDNEQTYSQPFLFGQDASALYGRSPDYPRYRDYEDYVNQEFTAPTPENFVIKDKQGNMLFDQEGYDRAMYQHQSKFSEHPQGNY